MKRKGIILIATMAAFFLAGHAIGAGFPMTAASPQASGGEIDGSAPFNIDIYMDNATGVSVTGFSASFKFYSPDGSIEDIIYHDATGWIDFELPIIEFLNSFGQYLSLSVHVDGDTYLDGTLPDYVNFTSIGTFGIPDGLGSQAYVRFKVQIDNSTTGTTGQLCFDSTDASEISETFDWDWQFPPEYEPASFDGPVCWTITNLTSTDATIFEQADAVLPQEFGLEQNYPNPFNPYTSFDFALPRQSQVTIDIFNVLGQKIKTLADGEYEAGRYTISWDGTNDNGSSAATGIYFYKMIADNFQDTKKLILLK